MNYRVQAIGILLAVAGCVLIAIAYMRGRSAGTEVADGPPPPGRARGLMAMGVGLLLAGGVITAASDF